MPIDQPAVLELRDVSLQIGGKLALKEISLAVGRGEIVGICGERGAGKNRLLQIVVGNERPSSGVVLHEGLDVTRLPASARKKRGIASPLHRLSLGARVRRVLGEQSLEGKLNEALRNAGHAGKLDRKTKREFRAQALVQAGLPDLSGRSEGALSMGQRQRFEVACLFASRPSLIVMDEPFKAADHVTMSGLVDSLRSLSREFGISLLLSDRSGNADRVCDRVLRLETGHLRPQTDDRRIDNERPDREPAGVFISYSRRDEAAALTIYRSFAGRGLVPWIDREQIKPGENWERAVEKNLKRSEYVVLVLSRNALGSANVLNEVSFSLNAGKQVLVVMIEDCELPLRVAGTNYVDGRTDLTGAADQVAAEIQRRFQAWISVQAPDKI